RPVSFPGPGGGDEGRSRPCSVPGNPAVGGGARMRTEQLSKARYDMSRRLHQGRPARVEEYLKHFSELANDAEQVLLLINCEMQLRIERGESLELEEYVRRFPQHPASELQRRL